MREGRRPRLQSPAPSNPNRGVRCHLWTLQSPGTARALALITFLTPSLLAHSVGSSLQLQTHCSSSSSHNLPHTITACSQYSPFSAPNPNDNSDLDNDSVVRHALTAACPTPDRITAKQLIIRPRNSRKYASVGH
ncbi:hypothetical protein J6590_030053 [Homalodisca vitripennis]|nr:hypothetical protein J6590_030053 [Homalodisca vitripennis]